jgi:hypothetical protein
MPYTEHQKRHIQKYIDKRSMAAATLQLHSMSIGIGICADVEMEKRLTEYIAYLDGEYSQWSIQNLSSDFAD